MIRYLSLLLFLEFVLSQELGTPNFSKNKQIINHKYYNLCYSEKHEQAYWVSYTLDNERLSDSVKRTNDFRIDPSVKTGSATLMDYKGSGYDRGHLAPAGDMKFSLEAMSESFFMSNMSPQVPSFNRGIWKKLEFFIRECAKYEGQLYIVTGPVLTGIYPTIGISEVSIPEYYFKTILDYVEPELKGIGFILPNNKSKKPLQSFAVSIDDVERITGIDFFHSLPDEIENKIESDYSFNNWKK